MGGYIQGGGHSPLSSIYGMAADQVLNMEVVTADGRFVAANAQKNPDLFWALRGGGGSTFGIVTSVVVKAYPEMQVTSSIFSFTSVSISKDTFWAGVRAYYNYFPANVDLGTYAYFFVLASVPSAGEFEFLMQPFFAPKKTLNETQAILQPWFDELTALGISILPTTRHFDSFWDA
ncbi:Uu.00g065190.m01.CDS01 [Anthostomella pinea]|uniref:Uu.00g065190.m01.CDS01 n=1 Tax=Anthostomella pinea TaxID=933095 RepID=A0AAI8YN20_9PEZI|nr:Uu.00g065190.m01.CDS01 [Anthostomella pinea]